MTFFELITITPTGQDCTSYPDSCTDLFCATMSTKTNKDLTAAGLGSALPAQGEFPFTCTKDTMGFYLSFESVRGLKSVGFYGFLAYFFCCGNIKRANVAVQQLSLCSQGSIPRPWISLAGASSQVFQLLPTVQRRAL